MSRPSGAATGSALGQPEAPSEGRPRLTLRAGHGSPMHFVHTATPVLVNERLARDTYLIRLHCPELARAIEPGQFLMILLPGHSDPLLGRPFALYDKVLDGHEQPGPVP